MNEQQNRPSAPCRADQSLRLTRVFFLLMGVGVAMGAFGAHALRDLRTPAQLETWKTATLYLLVHALAGMLLSLYSQPSRQFPKKQCDDFLQNQQTDPNALSAAQKIKIPQSSLWLFLWGSLFFAGSLYALVLTQISLLGAITPLGGLMFIAGWLNLSIRAQRL